MMRKLIALVLVLAIANVASAVVSYDILVNGEPWDGSDVVPSDMITFTFVEGDATIPGGGFSNISLGPDHGDYQADSFEMVTSGWLLNNLTVTSPVGDGFAVTGGSSALNLQVNPDGIFRFLPRHSGCRPAGSSVARDSGTGDHGASRSWRPVPGSSPSQIRRMS